MRNLLRWGSGIGLLVCAATWVAAEEITVTTYYPSPRGVYNELRSANNAFLATFGGAFAIGTSVPTTVNAAARAVVATNPQAGGGPCAAGFNWYDENGNVVIDANECKQTAFLIQTNGNVGLGVPAPADHLVLQGLDPQRLVITNTSIPAPGVGIGLAARTDAATPRGMLVTTTNHPLHFGIASISQMVLRTDAGGVPRLGIGTTTPNSSLQISQPDGALFTNTVARPLYVEGPDPAGGALVPTAAFVNNASRYGVQIGGTDPEAIGRIEAGQFTNGALTANADLVLNKLGGNVGIGREPPAPFNAPNGGGGVGNISVNDIMIRNDGDADPNNGFWVSNLRGCSWGTQPLGGDRWLCTCRDDGGGTEARIILAIRCDNRQVTDFEITDLTVSGGGIGNCGATRPWAGYLRGPNSVDCNPP